MPHITTPRILGITTALVVGVAGIGATNAALHPNGTHATPAPAPMASSAVASPTSVDSATPMTATPTVSQPTASPSPTTPSHSKKKKGKATASPSPTPSVKPTLAPTTGAVDVTRSLSRGVVLIRATNASVSSSGTGMVLRRDGVIMTNYHVLRSAQTVRVTVPSTKKTYTANLIGRDASHDIAVLKINATSLAAITPDDEGVKIGDMVVAVGNADGAGTLEAYAGRLMGTDRQVKVRGASTLDPDETLSGLLETDAHAAPGESGGPLFDNEYEVTGMTTAGISTNGQVTRAFAVPIGQALAIANQILDGRAGSDVHLGARATIGINAYPVTGGLRVTNVVAGSGAAKAGIKPGDTVTAVAGQPVPTSGALAAVLDRYRVGNTLPVTVTTAGRPRIVNVTLTSAGTV